jgi:hypothetical protein
MTDAAKIDTTIYIGDLAIHQPVTVLTDYIIAALCLFCFLQLKKLHHKNKSTANWNYFFVFLGLSSFMGGCSHAFFAVHEGFGYKAFWLQMQVLNNVMIYFAQRATLHSALQNSLKRKLWSISYTLQLILFTVAVFVFQNFLVVVIDTAVGLIPVMIIHFVDSKKVKASSFIAYGILTMFLTAVVNGAKLSIHTYFNYQDISHVLIMISLSLMFVGIKKKAIS